MPTTQLAPNAALWQFGSEMDENMFLVVAQEVIRLFVANVVIGSETGRARHLADTYLSGRKIELPPLKDIETFSLPESGNNTRLVP